MNETTLRALCTAELSLYIKPARNGYEVRYGYYCDNGIPDYTVEFSGDWAACVDYLRKEWESYCLRFM